MAFAELARMRALPMVTLRVSSPDEGVDCCSMDGGRLVEDVEGSVRLYTAAELDVGFDIGDARGLGSGDRIRGETIGRGEERGDVTGLSLSM